jgi:NADH-quinone oxidoreductase subunit L
MNGIAGITQFASVHIKGMQSGRVQQYAFVFITGAIALVLIFVFIL